MDVTTMMLLFQ